MAAATAARAQGAGGGRRANAARQSGVGAGPPVAGGS